MICYNLYMIFGVAITHFFCFVLHTSWSYIIWIHTNWFNLHNTELVQHIITSKDIQGLTKSSWNEEQTLTKQRFGGLCINVCTQYLPCETELNYSKAMLILVRWVNNEISFNVLCLFSVLFSTQKDFLAPSAWTFLKKREFAQLSERPKASSCSFLKHSFVRFLPNSIIATNPVVPCCDGLLKMIKSDTIRWRKDPGSSQQDWETSTNPSKNWMYTGRNGGRGCHISKVMEGQKEDRWKINGHGCLLSISPLWSVCVSVYSQL